MFFGFKPQKSSSEKRGRYLERRGVSQNSLADEGSGLPWVCSQESQRWELTFLSHPIWKVAHLCSWLQTCLIPVSLVSQIFLGESTFVHGSPGFTWPAFPHIQQSDQLWWLHFNSWERARVWPSLSSLQIGVPGRNSGPILEALLVGHFPEKGLGRVGSHPRICLLL